MTEGEWTGTILTGRFMPGGETTGLMLETDTGETYDLQPANSAVEDAIHRLSNEQAVVTGTSRWETGIERGNYQVIDVESIRPA